MVIETTEIIEENGTKYLVETYSNGTVVKTAYSESSLLQPEMSEADQAIFETQANTEYLVALLELS